MAIELRILTGARAGRRQRFDSRTIAIGRHPQSDLQLHPEKDLDVSARHAVLTVAGDRHVTIRDVGSTNGTFVNGWRIDDEQPLREGDIVTFGETGPRVELRLVADAHPAPDARAVRKAAATPPRTRRTTAERVAVAVQQHTRGLQRMLLAAILLLGGGVGFAYWVGHREAKRQVAELQAMLAHNDSVAVRLQGELARLGAPATDYADAMRQRNASLRTRVQGDADAPQDFQALKEELRRSQLVQQGLTLMDLPAISERNDAAVAFLVAELDGKAYGGTAFGITPDGLLVTNRHTVRSDAGSAPTRLAVKFANTDRYLRAHVVRVSDDRDVDLALVQVDEAGQYPVVAGIAGSVAGLKVGAPVVSIGFPHGLDTPMDGDRVKTSLEGGVVSKKLSGLLQIDSYAGHGSSGSPIFDADGDVVGVLYGGAAGSDGRIVYAVPGDRLAAFLPEGAREILR